MEIDTAIKSEYSNENVIVQESYISQKRLCAFSEIKVRMQEVIESLLEKKELTVDEQINDKFLNLDFASEFNIDASKIGVNDAIFFVNLLNRENLINYSIQEDTLVLNAGDKHISATQSLISMLKTSLDANKPIRLDFDRDVTVILRLDKEGKIQAHFIPGTSEVENYIKNNIPSLKQTFDEENINYSYLGYSKNKNQNSNDNKNKKRSDK